jgi:hypothetical protein
MHSLIKISKIFIGNGNLPKYFFQMEDDLYFWGK